MSLRNHADADPPLTGDFMFTRQRVIATASPNSAEILVVFSDEADSVVNVTLTDQPALRAQLIAAPATLPNPDYETVEGSEVSPWIANPARAPLDDQAFALAEQQLAGPG